MSLKRCSEKQLHRTACVPPEAKFRVPSLLLEFSSKLLGCASARMVERQQSLLFGCKPLSYFGARPATFHFLITNVTFPISAFYYGKCWARTAKQDFHGIPTQSVSEKPGHPPGFVLPEWAFVFMASPRPHSLTTSSSAFFKCGRS